MANLFTFPNISEGIDNILVDLSTEITAFPIMILMFVWMLIFLGGMGTQLARSSYADAPIWSTIAFLTTSFIAVLMSLQTGIINPYVLSVVIGGLLFSALWLFLSRGRFEN